MTDDEAIERWLARALDEAPALDATQADLVRRTYGRTHQTTDMHVSDAA